MDFTLISYPSVQRESLLSLSKYQSRYLLPFGGRFRIIDFTIRNSISSGADRTIIFNNMSDGLSDYLYGYRDNVDSPISMIESQLSHIEPLQKAVQESESRYFILYNGDNPSIIDFSKLIKKHKRKKGKGTLYRLTVDGRPSMSHKILVCNKELLRKTIEIAIKQEHNSPNIFEMVINMIINQGIGVEDFDAPYWPITTVTHYYNINMEIMADRDIAHLLFEDIIIKSQIKHRGFADIGLNAKIKNSFISDYCKIDGTVENSIIFPGVTVGKGSVIKNSIILPYVRIGEKNYITNSIIDESTKNREKETSKINITSGCHIGGDEIYLKSSDFPNQLFSGITLVGKNVELPDSTRIGVSCFVDSNIDDRYFLQSKTLHDGLSIIEKEDVDELKGEAVI